MQNNSFGQVILLKISKIPDIIQESGVLDKDKKKPLCPTKL